MVGEKDKRLKRFVGKINEKFGPELILLFGSRARGDNLDSSDFDILIVSEKFGNYDFRARIIKVYELLDEPLNVEVLCYTPSEFEERKNELCIVKEAFEEGVAL